MIPRFITVVLAGERPVVFGDGEQSRDFTYIDNTIDGTVLAATAGGGGRRDLQSLRRGDDAERVVEHVGLFVDRAVEAVTPSVGPAISLARWWTSPGHARHFGYEPAVGARSGLETTFTALEGEDRPR